MSEGDPKTPENQIPRKYTIEEATAAGLTEQALNVGLLRGFIEPPGPDYELGEREMSPETAQIIRGVESAVLAKMQGKKLD